MQFSEIDKQKLLALLKNNKRSEAIEYLAKTYHTSRYDAEKLLTLFEAQFRNELGFVKNINSATLGGCLSALLKVIAVIVGLISLLAILLSYFFIDWFGESWNNRDVPVIVKDQIFLYADSSTAKMIYEYENDGKPIRDTSLLDYNTTYYHIGDTINISAKELGLPLDEETLAKLKARQRIFFLIGGSLFLTSVIFWLVGLVFKVRPPDTEGGRYTK